MVNFRTQPITKPFLRWAGGKQLIAHHLMQFIPTDFNTYWEPFLGAGAIFFAIAPQEARLSDSNCDLINCYKCVREKPELIHKYLLDHISKTSEKYYYRIRDIYNRSRPSAAQAARFIYLNKTCFNGIYRVNKEGKFNVPYGKKEPPALPSLFDLVTASKLLKSVKLLTISYEKAFEIVNVVSDDFVYLDPPYPPLNNTSYFRHYTSSRFSWEDQIVVTKVANNLRDAGCHVMISNADLEGIHQLYQNWYRYTLPVVRWVAANGIRRRVNELVITNYKVNI